MRIVYISTASIPSRTANSIHVFKMCKEFSKNGNDVTLLYPSKQNIETNIHNIYNFYGVEKIFKIKKLYYPEFRGKIFVYVFFALLNVAKIKADIAYTRNIYSAFLCSFFSFNTVLELHQDVSDFGKIALRLFRVLVKFKSLLKIVVITKSLKLHLVKKYKIDPEIIHIAPDGADLIRKNLKPIKKIILNKRIQVGYTGHLYKGRGINLIQDLAKNCQWADFHLVGGNKMDIMKWKNKSQNIENIIFHGFVPQSEIKKYLISFDVLLAPYQSKVSVSSNSNISTENWMSPLKVFEYMSARKPIICSDIKVLREVLQNDVNCILCPPDKLECWIAGLHKIKNDKKFAFKIAQNAYSSLVENHTWHKRAKDIEKNIIN
tara:strand:+ start:525 stop:1652 length:1128 start_codon:yes stop_codon:yes gene_type:complete